ncbi:hypothetical protein [Microvirga flavescens]|uniref:hypothetical protein n=1 Tax=Microvirga flavescens TaxID=2249811 RepID=UPI000DD8B4E2|nr:hypothetical protein [Microvirga flavescens]
MLIHIAFRIALLLAICGWVGMLIGTALSVMTFDAAGSQGRWQAWAFVGGMTLLTVVSLVAIFAAKSLFQAESAVLAFVLLAVPAIVGAVFVVMRLLA